MEEWISKNIPWIVASAIAFFAWFVRAVVMANTSKERLEQVEINKKCIEVLQSSVTAMGDDITEIKEGMDKQARDTVAILSSLQSIMNALYESNSGNVGTARDRFNDYLAKR